MKYLNIKTQILAMAAISAVAGFSCKKADRPSPIGDQGKTIVKVMDGGDESGVYGHILQGIDFISTPQTITVLDVRRSPASNSDLNKSFNVSVKDDTAALRIYNDTNHTSIIPMPRDWYTVNVTLSAVGGSYAVPFAAGQFASEIRITINDATVLDPSSTYGIAFTLESNDANFVNGAGRTLVYEIGAKNAYDGVYNLVFSNYHPSSNPTYAGDEIEIHMVTTAGNKVKIYWPGEGFYNPAILGGSLSAFGAQEPEYTVDVATNKVTVQNSYDGAVTFYNMAAGYDSRYEPATKEIFCKWGYNNPGGVFNPAATREWTQHFTYTGPR